jgi:phage major head subunit gpT-like protein
MKLTRPGLDALRVGFNATFQEAFTAEPSYRDPIVERIASTTGENAYGWLADLPGMREWIGSRVVHGLAENEYRLPNRDFELTVSVQRNHIEDETLGTYTPRFRVMGRSTGRWLEELTWKALAAGFTSDCYDGQPFFDTAHPVIGENGDMELVANTDGGAGTAWYLMATKGIVKPLIEQTRKEPEFVARDNLDDDNVFFNKEFVYGTDARGNVGYGFWQMAWGSKQPLTPANYAKARAAILEMKGDHGRPLGIVPDTLVIPPSLESQANKIVKNALVDGGNTNEWAGTADVLMVPYLT